MRAIGQYFKNTLIAFDIFTNTIFGGSPKQTMSSRVYLYKDSNKIAKLVYLFLNWIDPGHCERALIYDMKGADNTDSVLK